MLLLRRAAYGLSHIFYPRLCAGCRRPLLQAEQVLCLHCADLLPRTQHHHLPDNETALRFAGRFPFVAACSFAYFTGEGLLQHLLHGLKYNGRKETGIFLGRQFAYDLQDTAWIRTIDLIVPVPLHPRKEATRGYNQSALIAEGMSGMLQLPWSGKLLRRIKHTGSQTKKTREERAENVSGAFALSGPVAGRHILLLDDVLTTGATLEACAIAVLSAGNVQVSLATIGLAV